MRFLLPLILCGALCGADARQELLEADRAFDADTARRGLDGWMAWFAPDAKLISAEGVVEGSAAIRQFYSGMFAQTEFSIRWTPVYAEASKDGSFGYTLGSATISFRDAKGEKVSRAGRYLTVWKRQPDGKFKVLSDMGS
jgi:ketosteroid isomerase-like protein